MLLYVNGDSHSAGAEAINYCCFAEDDRLYRELGRAPHPDNLKASYGSHLAQYLNADLVCEAESGGSNDRVIRTTREYLKNNQPDLIVIGWATLEREEWLHRDVYYQVSAGGIDLVPLELRDRYRQWVIDQADHETINNKYVAVHQKLFDFHNELVSKNIKHIFFNTYSHFAHIQHLEYLGAKPFDWQESFVHPYDPAYTYYNWAIANGCRTVKPESYHFGPDAHLKWADF